MTYAAAVAFALLLAVPHVIMNVRLNKELKLAEQDHRDAAHSAQQMLDYLKARRDHTQG